MDATIQSLSEEVRKIAVPNWKAGSFDPVSNWEHLGILVRALEERGCYLMTNSAADPHVKRMASFHKSTPRGFPCVGSSEWGRFPTHGEAILRAAHQALLAPRA